MRKILIPTDFSENSLNAIKCAVELFKYERCDFFILHAYADEVYDHTTVVNRELFEELKEKIRVNSDKELAILLDKIKRISPNPKHEYKNISAFGSLVDESNNVVEVENIDVIVMGTSGKTDNRKLTFGSNTLQVLKYVKCPVFAIPVNYRYQQLNNILFPTDYMLPYKRREIKLLSTMAKSFRSVVNFLYVTKFDNFFMRQEDNKLFLIDTLEGVELKFHNIEGKDLTSSINQYIVKNKIDLLVMVNSRHTYLENILYQSTIDKIGLHITIPFLVLQNIQRY